MSIFQRLYDSEIFDPGDGIGSASWGPIVCPPMSRPAYVARLVLPDNARKRVPSDIIESGANVRGGLRGEPITRALLESRGGH
jgi:hypothetical protein